LFHFDLFYPYAIAPALTALVCFVLAALTIQAGKTRREIQLFAIICLFQAALYLLNTVYTIISSKDLALSICRFVHLFYVFIIPIFVHFILEVAQIKHRKNLIRLLYLFSTALVPLSLTHYFYSGMHEYFFGFFPIGGPVFQVFGLIGLAATIYTAKIIWVMLKASKDPAQKLKARFILYGIIANAALTVANILPVLGVEIYPPGNFSFIPMGLMAYGLLRHEIIKTAKDGLTHEFIPGLLTIFTWSPLVLALLFLFIAPFGLFYSNLHDRIFPYALPPIISFLTCFILATICFLQKTPRLISILFGLICTLWGFLNLGIMLVMMTPDKHLALYISRLAHFFLVNQLGISIHFIYSIIGRKKRWTFVYPCYFLGIVLMPLTLTNWYFNGVHKYFWGFFAQGNIAFDSFSLFSAMVLIWGMFLLFSSIRAEADADIKKTYFYVFIGVLITALFNLCNLPALYGIGLYPIGNFTFIPILIMGYGIFRYNILKINIYTRRRILDKIVKAILILGYTALIPVCYWALFNDHIMGAQLSGPWHALDPLYIFSRIYPFGIPPLIAIICAAYISMLTIRVGKHQIEALIFGMLCLLMAFVSCDILLNNILVHEAIGLHISRLDHLFLVFAPAFSLHLVFLIIGRKKLWWQVSCAYLFALFLMPMTQTRYYIHGMYHYYWGFFADGAVLFDVFSIFFLVTIIYGTILLANAYRKTDDRFQKHRLFYLALGFAVMGTLYMGNTLILMGYEIYPPGNFVFIPLLIWAYAFFRQNLQDALQQTKTLCLYTGTLVTAFILAIIFKKICPSDRPDEIYLAGIILSLLILRAVYFAWGNILALFFGEQRHRLKQALENVLDGLSRARTSWSVFQISRDVVFSELLSAELGMLTSAGLFSPDLHKEHAAEAAFYGLNAVNPKKDFFSANNMIQGRETPISLASDHPLLMIFDKHQDLVTREQIEEFMMEYGICLAPDDPLYPAEFILPVYFEGNLNCLLFFGNKINGTDYSRDETEFIHDFGLSLGPYLENVNLLQNIEKKVKDRTIELLTARRDAESANKAKSEFLANMSHEIRTPLNALMGAVEIIKDNHRHGEEREIIDMLNVNSKILLTTINDIIDISKIEAGKIDMEHIEFDLKTLIKNTCRVVEGRAREKGLTLYRYFEPDLPAIVKGDPTLLQQVFINLAGNAVKFTLRGEVSIRCGYGQKDASEFLFSVSDTGIGIPENKQEKIFEGFTQADASTTREFGGTGLGLTISKKFVELMGGRIWVKSSPGLGSTFYFTAKLEKVTKTEAHRLSDQAEKHHENKAPVFSVSNPAHILLVDDYVHNRTIIMQYLKDTPLIIDIAKNGSEAVENFGSGGYDLILMDLQMPEMDGYDATREIRRIEKEKNLDHTPVIALSAYALREDRVKSIEAGCDVHLNKPLKKKELLEVMAKYIPGAEKETETSGMPIAGCARDALPPQSTEPGGGSGNPAVLVDPVFKKIIPQYLQDIKNDVEYMAEALKEDDFEAIRLKSHDIKGSGGGFGFNEISRIGNSIEDAAKAENKQDMEKRINELSLYMAALKVEYRE